MDTKPALSRKKLSPLNAWAFSFACAIGWAAFVMPATFFLPRGGLRGSTLAFLAGAAAMSVIALNYHYLGNLYPERGGIFNLVESSIGRDHAFVASWAMGLAHLCCIPLNARALGMLLRTILEEVLRVDFEVCFLHSDTLLIEAVIVVAALIGFGWLNARGIRQTAQLQTAGALVLLGGIVIMLVAVLFVVKDPAPRLEPAYGPGTVPLQGFMTVFIMTPWAFVGFDSLSKVSDEVGFPLKKLGLILVISVLCGAFAYVANIYIALLGMPDGARWPEYMEQVRGLAGVEAYPVALAARHTMGTPGLIIFFAACISATLTGLVGFFASISRLIAQMAQGGMLPRALGELDPERGTPVNAVWTVVVIALLLSLLRNAFDFIEELASVATSVGYGYCSLCALLMARRCGVRRYAATGLIGLLLGALWVFFLLVPVPGLSSAISRQATVCVIGWIFVGIAFYAFFTRRRDDVLEV